MSTNDDNILYMEIVVNNNANDDNDNTINDGTLASVFSRTLPQKTILRLTEDEEYVMCAATHKSSTPEGQTNTSLRIIFTNKDGWNPW